MPGKCVYVKAYRGFESHPVRSKLLSCLYLTVGAGLSFLAGKRNPGRRFCHRVPICQTVRKKRDRNRCFSVH